MGIHEPAVLLNIVSGSLGLPVATKGATKVATKSATKGATKSATKGAMKGAKKGATKEKKLHIMDGT